MTNQPPPKDGEQRRFDDVEDMAAGLFADLFYNQVMMEREEKRRQQEGHNQKLDTKTDEGLQSTHET